MPITIGKWTVGTPISTREIQYRTYETESLTIADTAGGVRISEELIDKGTARVVMTLETAQIRWQLEAGLVITAGGTEGSPLMEVGDTLTLLGYDDIFNARFIRRIDHARFGISTRGPSVSGRTHGFNTQEVWHKRPPRGLRRSRR